MAKFTDPQLVSTSVFEPISSSRTVVMTEASVDPLMESSSKISSSAVLDCSTESQIN